MLSKKYAKVDKDVCVACGACTNECPKSALSVYRGCYAMIDEALCVGCGKCVRVCPTGCILLTERKEN